MNIRNAQFRLHKLYKQAESISIPEDNKLVFFSDMHMGNGKKRDDFRKNGVLVHSVLEKYYLKNDFNLFLNGDIEELLKFPLYSIRKKWASIYDLFYKFQDKNNLYKLLGNHDHKLFWDNPTGITHYPAILLKYGAYKFFIYHGHQSSFAYNHFGALMEFLLYWVARPLNIKNLSIAYNNHKKYSVEKGSYSFSRKQQIISIIGHTHRPLFESLSRRDNLLFLVEKSLRKYSNASEKEQLELRKKIKKLNDEIIHNNPEDFETPLSCLYSSGFVQPCLFNSGCTIGKRGISCLEIENGKISLVHWFDEERKSKYKKNKNPYETLPDTNIHRIVLKTDDLRYIQDSIELLS